MMNIQRIDTEKINIIEEVNKQALTRLLNTIKLLIKAF